MLSSSDNNLALNKTYSEPSQASAANGDTRGDPSGSCFTNAQGTWEVDLGANYAVHDFKIWAQTDSTY
jgi:hypothetical protein